MTPPELTTSESAAAASSNLVMRIAAALVMAPLALAAAWFGGALWLILATLVAIGLYAEWLTIVGAFQARLAGVGCSALVAAAIALWFGRTDLTLLAIIVGLAMSSAMLPRSRRWWAAAGLCYAAVALVASVVLRQDPAQGFAALVLVFAVVWATDIMGYVAGRSLGGPKLWPRVSPKKTWSGAIGSVVGSLAVGAAFAAAGFGAMKPILVLALVLSAVSQLGDLFESAIKRRFGVKDSSHVIPGHGGLLDRLDGFVAAVALASLIGVLRGGFAQAGSGLLNW